MSKEQSQENIKKIRLKIKKDQALCENLKIQLEESDADLKIIEQKGTNTGELEALKRENHRMWKRFIDLEDKIEDARDKIEELCDTYGNGKRDKRG